MATQSPLFQPLQVGQLTLDHRIVMAPLTRFRADDQHVPLPFVSEYYSQRGSVPGTLLVSEGTFIDAQAGGTRNVPGIYNAAQILAWKDVTAAAHAKGSYIFCQLWALGRSADPEVCEEEGIRRLSSSAVPVEGRPAATPMTKQDIDEFIQMYVQAAQNAIEAGFDGVELHGANGYLLDQFIQENCNQRDDEYGGGSIENRARFYIEVAQAVSNAIGAHRTGARLSPWSQFQGMRMVNPVPQFTFLIERLAKIDLAYIHLVESRVAGNLDVDSNESLNWAIKAWGPKRAILIAGSFKPDTAKRLVEQDYPGYNMAVVFDRYFISIPDLPFRIKHGLDLEMYDRARFYKPKSPEGYIDYPFSAQFTELHL